MCGYQGWFCAEGDCSGRGWVHYGKGEFDPHNSTVDLWPDVTEYKKTYPTGFKLEDGSSAGGGGERGQPAPCGSPLEGPNKHTPPKNLADSEELDEVSQAQLMGEFSY